MNLRTHVTVLSLFIVSSLVFCAAPALTADNTLPAFLTKFTKTTVTSSTTATSTKTRSIVVSSTPVSTLASSTVKITSVPPLNGSSTPLTTDFIVQAADLEQAGFAKVERLLPLNGRFDEPIRYFRVAQTLDKKQTALDCDDCSNLAVVYVTRAMPTSTPLWVVRANPLIVPMAGRLQLQWFAANRIIYVIAPGGEDLVRTLGARLRERAILGKLN